MLFGDVVLLFSGRRRSGIAPDSELQEALRTRLRVVESNSQDVVQLFKVRHRSIHAKHALAPLMNLLLLITLSILYIK